MDEGSYGVFIARYSGWPGIIKSSTSADGTKFLSQLFEEYDCPEMIRTDGAKSISSREVENFLEAYVVQHRVSSLANSHANCRAELGVKKIKQLLKDNIGVH